ncbi:MAG: homoserine dehydrogenase [Candidatus Hodarchaeales archaeon]|jgi:homoserine dehydrogenase
MHFKLAFIGFGVVGQGLAEILVETKTELKTKYNFEFSVVAISDKLKGSVYHPDGINLEELLDLVKKTGKIVDYQKAQSTGWDSLQTIKESNANIIIEVSWTDIQTGEPALTHVKTALTSGKHVVMTNKGPVALAVKELLDLAAQHDVHLKFEGTVLAGTPAINLGLNNLAGSGITEIQGILNGTTNYILTEMEKNNLSFDQALKQAQELGYAEADPTGDVEGWDALGKVVILTNVIMGHKLSKNQVEREGITKITPTDIEKAKSEGKRWKLIATMVLQPDGSIKASVKPEVIPLSHPLAGISGPTNALMFRTKYVGDITIVGPGAGKLATGFALLNDLLEINRNVK